MIKWFLAYFRFNQSAICALSQGPNDYHDYPDSIEGVPMHFHTYRCKHCGKEFEI